MKSCQLMLFPHYIDARQFVSLSLNTWVGITLLNWFYTGTSTQLKSKWTINARWMSIAAESNVTKAWLLYSYCWRTKRPNLNRTQLFAFHKSYLLEINLLLSLVWGRHKSTLVLITSVARTAFILSIESSSSAASTGTSFSRLWDSTIVKWFS